MRQWLHVARGILAVAAITALCRVLQLNTASSGLLFLLALVLNALDSTFTSAAVVSIFAVGCLDFFFTEPDLSLRVARVEDLITLVAFLTVSLVITKLGASAREQARNSERQRLNTEQIYRVTEQLLALKPGQATGSALLEPFVRVLELTSACIFDGERAESSMCGESRWHLAGKTRDAFIRDEDLDEEATGIVIRRIFWSGKVTGTIGFEGLRNASAMAGPLAAVAASSIHRTRAFEAAGDAAAQAQAETLRGAILDALAHEFKTPLATILTAAGGMREVGALSPAQEELAEILETEASRLGSLTTQLLQTARLDREEVKLRRERMELAEFVEQLVSRYASLWPEHQFVVRGGDLQVEVLADPELIRLVLNQLADNACKYSTPGTTVECRLESSGGEAAVVVWSASEPILSHERARVFDRFYRGARLRERAPGTGLGLYVARKIALAHGGDLTLELQETARGGNAFRLVLPATEGRRSDVEAETPDRR